MEGLPEAFIGEIAYFWVLLTGFENLFIDLGSGYEFHPRFFSIAGDGEGSVCGNNGRRRRGSLVALAADFYLIFLFCQSGVPCLRARNGCNSPVIMKSNASLKKLAIQ